MPEVFARLLIALLLAVTAGAAHADTRGLLIGVSAYESAAVPDLEGPANDVPAMAALLKSMGASDMTVLRDAAATRTSIEAALQELGARSRAGDWLVLYYSGHGAQAGGGGAGDPDQFILLPRFDPDKQDPERFIVDKDFYAWLQRYVPGTVRILMVVDSCHSGSMYRAVDPRLMAYTSRLGFRAADERAFRLVERPGPRLPALNAEVAGGTADRRELPNLVYIGASQDDELALETELPQEGSPQRGVLTFALEQGLSSPGVDPQTLAADMNLDGAVSVVELAAYLGGQVRMLSAQRQQSAAAFLDDMASVPLFSTKPRPTPAPSAQPFAVSVIDGRDPPALIEDDGLARLAPSPREADFQWIVKSGIVIRRSGDVVGSGIGNPVALSGLLRKWTTIAALRPLVAEAGLRLTLKPFGDDALYPEGSTVTVGLDTANSRLRRDRAQYVTVFDLTADGTLQLLYPLPGDGAGLIAANEGLTVLEARVVAPFGADHVVALATPERPADLQNLLRALDGRRVTSGISDQIRAVLRQAKGAGSLSILEIYTSPTPN